MSPGGRHLSGVIAAARRGIRRDARIAAGAVAALVLPVMLGIAWLLAGRSDWSAPSAAPLLLELAGLIALVAIAAFLFVRWGRGSREQDVAATAEETLGLPAGSVMGALELGRSVPAGTSPALAHLAEFGVAGSFRGRTPREVSGRLGRLARRRRLVALVGLAVFSGGVAVLGFASPSRTQAAWAPLLSPVGYLASSHLPPLEVVPGDAEVLRGSDLDVTIRAGGRSVVTLVSRAEGDVPRRQTIALVDGVASAALEKIDALTRYWVEAPDGARSPTYRVVARDPLLISQLTIEVRYPAYLGRMAERFETEVPPLELPEGTAVTVSGRATRTLSQATLAGAAGSVQLGTDAERFAASFVPAASGVWEWVLRDATGAPLATAPPPLDITVVPDTPPEVEITYPAMDTVLDPGRVHLIAGDGRDDYGITEAMLVHWRITAGGRSEARVESPIPLSDEGERLLLRAVLDLQDRDLLPGDTIRYFMRVVDNSPRRQVGESRTWAIYVPMTGDLRDLVDRQTMDAVAEAEELARTARELQESMRNLQRRTEASRARRNDGTNPETRTGSRTEQGTMGFRESEQGRQVLEQQEQLSAGLEELRDRMAALEKLMEAAGLQDRHMRERLEELRALYDALLTPEMKQQVEQLREALEKLDPEQLQRALEELSKQQAQLREQLESSLEQLRQAALEQRASALAQEARELATQQQALADAMREQPRPEQAAAQRELEERARQLGKSVEDLTRELTAQKQDRAGEDATHAQSQVRAAEQAMKDAAQRASSGQSEQAARTGEQAATQLEQAAKNLDAARQSLADAARRELEEGMQQAMNEALSLAERQQSLLDRMEQMRQQQQAAQQGQQQQGQQQQGQRGQQQGQRGQQQGQQQQQQGQQAGGQQGGAGGQDMQGMRSEQAALQQGLEQLTRNLGDLGQQTGMLSRDVGAALGRANLSMQQTAQALEQSERNRLPTQEAAQSVEALNRLALALLENQRQIQQAENATGMQQALQQLQDLAQQQGALNGRTSALMPLDLTPRALAQQSERLAREQREIAAQLGDLNQRLNRDELLGRMDQLAQEAAAIAQQLEAGRPPPQVLARQERLFHRLLDAGRTLEKDEQSEERVGERPGEFVPAVVPALNPALLDAATRYRVPTPDELRALPPAYRKLILDYFDRINRRPARGEREPM